jgi:hypothetical protein
MVFNVFLKRSLLLSLAFVISVSAVLPLLVSPVGAANINDATPTDEAKSASYYRTLRTCINNEMNTTIQLTGSDNGVAPPSKWFTDNNAYGYVFPEGKMDCKTIVPKAMTLWGFGSDYSSFLKTLGFTYDASDAKWTVANRDNLRNKFDSAVQAKYYGINFADEPTQSGPARYVMFLNVFQKACNAKNLGTVSSVTNTSYKAWLNDSTADRGSEVSEEKANVPGTKDGSYVYFSKIDIVDPATGAKVQQAYAYQASSTVTNAGWNGDGATSNGNVRIYGYHNASVERSCHQIQKGITENATAFRAWQQAHPAAVIVAPIDTPGTTPGGITDEATAPSCTIEGIGWIVCPAINALAYIADGSFNFLADSFLKTDPRVFNTEDGTYKAWAIMRNVANILFVIAFLFIVFSQLTGVGISNYGVKKMLPRIVVAAILVNLSYFISQLAIDVSNILGYSIRDVFDGIVNQIREIPTGNSAEEMSVLAAGDGGFVTLAGSIIAIAGGAAALYLMLSAFAPILLAAVLALVLIFFILLARQAIIVLLVVLSPLAFVAFLLPNTQSLFKQWRKILTAMLMLFPIIALVYGASALASTLLGKSFSGIGGTDSAMFGQIISAGILVLPLFAVPILLKKSLDSVPEVGKFANKWASKGFAGFGGKVREGNRNSYVGRGNAIRKQGRQIYSDRKFASNVSKGGIGALAAKGLAITPKGKYARSTVGRIADEASEKAFENDISAMAVSLKNTHINPDTQIDDIASELTGAIASGDKVKARAAQSILLNSGGAGLDTLHRTLEAASTSNPAMRNSDVGVSLRTALNNAGLKGKDNALASFAYNDAPLASLRQDKSTFKSLNSVELAGQRTHVLQDAVKNNAITPQQAQAVLADNVSKDMDPTKKALFQAVANLATPGGTTPPPAAGGTGGPRPPFGGPTPSSGGTSAPSSTPGATFTSGNTPGSTSFTQPSGGPAAPTGGTQQTAGAATSQPTEVNVNPATAAADGGLYRVNSAGTPIRPKNSSKKNDGAPIGARQAAVIDANADLINGGARAQAAAAAAQAASLGRGETFDQAKAAADEAYRKNGGA